jgi:peroxiredoxin Q/BCP
MNTKLLAGILSSLALVALHGAETQSPAPAKSDAKPQMHTENQPTVGQMAPTFSLPSGDGSTVSLKDFKGKWVVLYFYPKDFTGGCTLEAKNFEHDLSKYQSEGAVVLGVSVDSAQSHKDFCAKEGLNFKLLADPDAKTDGGLWIGDGLQRRQDGGAEYVPDRSAGEDRESLHRGETG